MLEPRECGRPASLHLKSRNADSSRLPRHSCNFSVRKLELRSTFARMTSFWESKCMRPSTIGLTSPWTPPPYVNESSFVEQDVSANAGWSTAVKGTLTLPRKSGPHPAVIMLPGSGDGERDVSVGAIKPGKDLAWGLASKDVVALRLEKPLLKCALRP